jgi:hypothetical protein
MSNHGDDKTVAILTFYVDEAGKHRWRLQTRNGEVVAASSQGYSRQQGAWANMFQIGQILGLGNYETRYDKGAPIDTPPDP